MVMSSQQDDHEGSVIVIHCLVPNVVSNTKVDHPIADIQR